MLRQSLAKVFCDSSELSRDRGLPIFACNGHPAIARFARGDVDGDLAKQRNAEALRFAFAAAASENIVTLPVRWRDEVTHVLNEAKDRHVDLVEHGGGFARIYQRNFLRGSYDDRSR